MTQVPKQKAQQHPPRLTRLSRDGRPAIRLTSQRRRKVDGFVWVGTPDISPQERHALGSIHRETSGDFQTSALARIDPRLLTKIGPPHISSGIDGGV